MFIIILIIFFTLIGLMTLHEFGHFLVAKKFGVKVEEFGVGYPPRIFGKKIKGTIYSLNLLPFGAFVKILGSDERVKHPESFSQKAIWQRALILLGGVVSFWIIAFVLLTLVAGIWGIPTVISEPIISSVATSSPAENAGIKPGDEIISVKTQASPVKEIDTINQLQEFIDVHRGEEITLTLQREEGILEVPLVPRLSPPEGEGPIGIVYTVEIVDLKYPWYEAPWQSSLFVCRRTIEMPQVLGGALVKALKGEKVEGIRFVGPIGIGEMMSQAMDQGVGYFFLFVSMISIWMALFNLFPIPALDGGRLLFLAIEGVRRKPVSQKLEQKITITFFLLLICLMVFVTIKDIIRLF